MKKWAIIDDCGTDEYLTVCESKEQAVKEADGEWNGFTKTDKDRRNGYMVGLINVDENGDCYTDESGNVDADVYEVAKKYK